MFWLIEAKEIKLTKMLLESIRAIIGLILSKKLSNYQNFILTLSPSVLLLLAVLVHHNKDNMCITWNINVSMFGM